MESFLIVVGLIVAFAVTIQVVIALNFVMSLEIDKSVPDSERTSRFWIFLSCLFCIHKFYYAGSHTEVGSDDYTHRYDENVCSKCGVCVRSRH